MDQITLKDALETLPKKGKRHGPQVCFYCRRYATRIEYDHFPLPYTFGGTTVVPACLTCHDLKDRKQLRDWPPEAILEAFEGLTPKAALLLSKVVAIVFEQEVPRDERTEPRVPPKAKT